VAPDVLRRSVVAGVAAAVLLVAVSGAGAYTRPCSDPAVWDPDVCERVEATAASASVSADYAELQAVGVWFVYGGLLMLIAAPMMTAAFRWWRA
jgi:hypothetical protein